MLQNKHNKTKGGMLIVVFSATQASIIFMSKNVPGIYFKMMQFRHCGTTLWIPLFFLLIVSDNKKLLENSNKFSITPHTSLSSLPLLLIRWQNAWEWHKAASGDLQIRYQLKSVCHESLGMGTGLPVRWLIDSLSLSAFKKHLDNALINML